MLTVNHTISTPSRTTENIFQVKEITHYRVERESLGDKPSGVSLIMPEGYEIFHPERQFGGIDNYEKFYVMNDQGKTIATYSL